MKKNSYSFLLIFFARNFFRFPSKSFIPIKIGEKILLGGIRKTWLCIVIFFTSALCSAQQNSGLPELNQKIDSLQKVLQKAKHDTLRAAVYVALSEELYLSDIDTVLPLCFKAIAIADAGLNGANASEKQSFLITKANALNNIGYVYKQQGDITKALEWYNKSLKIREEIGNKYGIANSINNIGRIYNIQGNNRKAIEYYKKSLKIQNDIGDKQGASISLNNIGLMYLNQGDIPEALEYYNKSLKIQDEIGDKQGVGISLYNIGHVYSTQNNFPKALEAYHNSLKILEEVGDKNGISILYNGLGMLYKDQGVLFLEASVKEEYFGKALEFYNKSLKIHEANGNKDGIARALNNIGYIFDKQAEQEANPDSIRSKLNKALEWNMRCLKIWNEIGNKESIAITSNNIGGIYLKQASSPLDKNKAEYLLKNAEEYCRQSLTMASELNFPEHIRNASERLSIIYKRMGESAFASGNMGVSAQRYKDAMKMQDLFKLTADKINNVEMQKSILKKQMQFEFKKRETEVKAKQDKKDTEAKEEKQRQYFYLSAVALGFMLVVVFTLFVFRSYRQKQKLNIELEKLSIVASETDNGVIICGPNGTLEWVNAGMIRLLGYNLEEWKQQGKTLQDISHNPNIKEKVEKSIGSKQTVSYESLNISKDGRKLWVHSTLTPILNEKGDIKKLVVIDTDITERKQAENIIHEKNREITDSIHSAKRIQHALLASDTLLKKHLPEFFVLYKPKDIVSGDFYWANVIDNKFVIITADCTGHGVPGAFMSLLNISYLNEAIIEKRIDSPEKILEHVRSQIISTLNPEGSEVESKDGMDAVLCIYDFKHLWLRFACANNPLWVIRKNELIRFKPDKMPVGMHYGEQKPFSINTLGLRKGDIVYTFTDGYADQFGGPKGKKFKYKALKEVLLSIQTKSMEEQKEILHSTFEKWKGSLEQVDDVLIIGVRV
ncbi:MAG: tetratricopeptide repeat protein [Bacteroidota bacterium]